MQHFTAKDVLLFVPFAAFVVAVITWGGWKLIEFIEATEQSEREKEQM